jgi:uncharacterized membrane protein
MASDNSLLPDEPAGHPLDSPVWTYGSYRLEGGTFATALIHFYRAEITRANTWRNRLDVTTNWAVVSTAAAISFAFSQPDTHHSVIILINALVTLFLFIEARRYRYYEMWSYRVRLIETDFYAAMLVPPFQPQPTWSQRLADSLLHPKFPITFREAFGRRLRRNYVWIYLILGAAWLAKLFLYASSITSVADFARRARIGIISGELVILFQLVFYLTLIIVGILTFRLQEATGELLHRSADEVANVAGKIDQQQAAIPPK